LGTSSNANYSAEQGLRPTFDEVSAAGIGFTKGINVMGQALRPSLVPRGFVVDAAVNGGAAALITVRPRSRRAQRR
jgi:uncharacterized membrane protein